MYEIRNKHFTSSFLNIYKNLHYSSTLVWSSNTHVYAFDLFVKILSHIIISKFRSVVEFGQSRGESAALGHFSVSIFLGN